MAGFLGKCPKRVPDFTLYFMILELKTPTLRPIVQMLARGVAYVSG
jgi:hypothetical protein